MSETRHPAEDARLRAMIQARKRFTFGLALLVSLTYTLLILLMAFAPAWLTVPIWPGSGISSGLLACFLYALLSLLVMRIWVERQTSDRDGSSSGRESSSREH